MDVITEDEGASCVTGGEARHLLGSTESYLIIKEFIMLKSLDVVSSGQYRKFVLRKKDLCEKWALQMHDNYHMMTVEVRNIGKYVAMAKSQGFVHIALVCTTLTHCV